MLTGVFGGITLKLLQWLSVPPKEEIKKFFAKRDPGKNFENLRLTHIGRYGHVIPTRWQLFKAALMRRTGKDKAQKK